MGNEASGFRRRAERENNGFEHGHPSSTKATTAFVVRRKHGSFSDFDVAPLLSLPCSTRPRYPRRILDVSKGKRNEQDAG